MKKRNIPIYVVLIICALVTVFPLLFVISASFKTNAEILTNPAALLPRTPTLQNYIDVWNSDVLDIKRMLFNSTYYTLGVVACGIITTAMSGYVFAVGNFRGKKLWLTLFSITMFFQMGSLTIYPLLDILKALHVPKSLPGLMLVKIFSVSIINIYLVRGFVYSLPMGITEAAEIDGCGFCSTFFHIIMPLLKPVLATIGILGFQGSWNDYLLPMIFTLGDPKQRPLIVGIIALSQSGEAAASYNLVFAGTVLALVPVLIAYVVANKHFVSGLSAGAMKG